MQYLAEFGFSLVLDDYTALGGAQIALIILSSWHSCRVHVIFIQILKRNNPKESAISSQSTAQSHIITANLALKGQHLARNMDLLHSRPYTGTREWSDVMK